MADYERLSADDRIPLDAVVLEITSIYGRSVADITVGDEIASLPVPVHQALEKAEALRRQLGLKRIVIRIADEKLWNPAWGRLVWLVA